MGVPPAAATWHRTPTGHGQNTTTPSGLQAPPRPTAPSAISFAGPRVISMAFSLFAKKPIDRLSGD
jgi:hypothetical protein